MTIRNNDEDFGAIITCAIRYCLVRRTYMPGLVCGKVKPMLPHLSMKTLNCIFRDVAECTDYGDDCDKETWDDFMAAVTNEIVKRSEPKHD